MLRTDLLQENIKPSKHGLIIVGLAQSSAIAILVIVDALDDNDVVFSLVVTSIRVVCESEVEVLIDEGISVVEVVGDNTMEP